MATITISMDNDVEQKLRTAVRRLLGERKGVLKTAIQNAILQWIEEEEQKRIGEEAIALMKKGAYSLKGWKFNRAEIYDRR